MNLLLIYKFLKSKKGREIPVREKLIHGLPLSKDELNIKGSLNLMNTPIKFLPNNLNVGGSLFLNGTKIKFLPDNLSVNESLYLSVTSIKSLPNNLKVEGNIFLMNTPLSQKYKKREMGFKLIRKDIEDKGGNVGGKIYL